MSGHSYFRSRHATHISLSTDGGSNMAAFLDTLAFSEGTSTVAGSDDGYNLNVGGELFHG